MSPSPQSIPGTELSPAGSIDIFRRLIEDGGREGARRYTEDFSSRRGLARVVETVIILPTRADNPF